MERTGQFKIQFDHELKTGFMGTSIKHGYLIGHGPLSAYSVVDEIAYTVVEKVTHDGELLADVLSELYSDPFPSTETVPKSCQATVVDEEEFEDYSADTEFTVYMFHYRDASINKDGCGFASDIMGSRKEYLELAGEVDDLHDEEYKGFGPGEPADSDIATLDEF